MSSDNKTEQATPRKREKSLEKGQIARSRELPAALAILAAAVFLSWSLPAWGRQWSRFFRNVLELAAGGGTLDAALFQMTTRLFLGWMIPLLLVCWALSVVIMLAQGGFIFAPAALTFNLERMSPAKEFSRIFSVEGVNRLIKSIVPVFGLLYLAGAILVRDWSELLQTTRTTVPGSFAWLWERSFEMAWKLGLFLLVMAVIDYVLQRVRHERSLRMSKQEITDEMKEMQGSPQVRQRIRRLQREARSRRMLGDVTTATVVLTNPTHFAVALRYDPGSMAAPTLVAKGQNRLALEIRRIATWNNVPIVENPPLARALFQAVDVGQTIPEKLYAAVAEILAFLYRTEGRIRSTTLGAAVGGAR